ncbi:MAG: cytochrome c [Chromatiales bacterium]|nr:cytochrome c [Chromatiales bacterium]
MKALTTVSLLALALFSSNSQAADATRGTQLHNEQCMGCHASRLGYGNSGNDIYTRENRRVTTLAGLQKQVDRCKNNLQIVWFDEDVADVAEYLNATFYHFGQE